MAEQTSPVWAFHNPVALRFGVGCARGQAAALPPGPRLLVTTRGMVKRGMVQRLLADLGNAEGWEILDAVTTNPEVSALESHRAALKAKKFAALVSFGGGSAVDTAKVLSILLGAPDDFDLRAHLEGKVPMPDVPPVPHYAIPTTSGTGAEVTPFATVWATAEGKKFSFAGPRLFPKAAWLDPEYTTEVDRSVTVSTGLDAFSQALESAWNRNANPYTLMIATRSAALSYRALQSIPAWPISLQTRAELMEASLLAGLAISHTRTALAHSMSYPITAHYGVPHGLACGYTLSELYRYNLAVDDGRFEPLARAVAGCSREQFADAIDALLVKIGVPALMASYMPDLAVAAKHAPEMFTKGRADNNLRAADVPEIAQLLKDVAARFAQFPRS